MHQVATISDETPMRMRPTRRSVFTECACMVSGVSVACAHAYFLWTPHIYYPVAFIWILTVSSSAYLEVDGVAFRQSMSSFRGLMIALSLSVTALCDVSSKWLREEPEPLLSIIISEIVYVSSIVIMLSPDSVPKISNFSRVLGPLCILCLQIWQIVRDRDTLLTVHYDSTTTSYSLYDITVAAKTTVVIYGSTLLWAMPRDPTHSYFALMDCPVTVKSMVPLRDKATRFTPCCPYILCSSHLRTDWIFRGIAISNTLFAICFVALESGEGAPLTLYLTLQTMGGVVLLTLSGILILGHFQRKMVRELILQFRANLVVVAMATLLFFVIWTSAHMHCSDGVLLIGNSAVFGINVSLLYVRDGMNVRYSTYFVVLGSVMLGSASLYNWGRLVFGEWGIVYAEWLLFPVTTAFFQITIVCFLSLFWLCRDRENRYAVLIRKRKSTLSLWGNLDPEPQRSDLGVLPESDVYSLSPLSEELL